jgi:hypothetical protein
LLGIFKIVMKLPDFLCKDIKAAIIGTLGSGIGAFLLLPLTSEFVKKQVDLKRTRKDFIRDVSNAKAMLSLYKLSGRAVTHALTRSFTFLGVGNIVLRRMQKEDSAAKRGLYAGLCAGASQAILTTWFSHSVIAGLSNQPRMRFRNIVCDFHLLRRLYSVAMVKNAVDQGVALMVAQVIRQYLSEEDILESGSARSFASGATGASVATLFSMPLVSAETNALSNPRRPLREWVCEVALKADPRLFWRGAGVRLIRASLGLGIGLTVTDWMNEKLFEMPK